MPSDQANHVDLTASTPKPLEIPDKAPATWDPPKQTRIHLPPIDCRPKTRSRVHLHEVAEEMLLGFY